MPLRAAGDSDVPLPHRGRDFISVLMPLRAAGDSDPRLLLFSQAPPWRLFGVFYAYRAPLAPFFRSFGLFLSHFLRCYPILRTPLPFLPILSPFSRGGAQNRLPAPILHTFSILTRVNGAELEPEMTLFWRFGLRVFPKNAPSLKHSAAQPLQRLRVNRG